ncbi:MAG: hypothetical protein IPO69_21245 [Saprospiraceae bacterium]|nr:hypothetical protein [Saprospiraceae bacterium]MBK9681351.1 hypothetical protein [Saprospiraceae bacterium]
MKIYLPFLCALFVQIVAAQTSVTLKGKVVELHENKTTGVPGVVVSVSGESYDVTAQDGSFKLFAPDGLDQVTITIKGTTNSMVTPYDGKVNLPPLAQPILIRICNEKNVKLLEKIQGLNNRIKKMQVAQKLSDRQVEQLQQTMIDTILHFQAVIEDYATRLESSESTNKDLQQRILQLEKTNSELEEKLFIALGEKYKNQKIYFDDITKNLNNYISRLKDVHKNIPENALACLSNTPMACDRFYQMIDKYNQARNVINEQKEIQVKAVEQYWSDPSVAVELQKLYTYILEDIHQPLLFDKMNEVIIDPLKSRSQGNLSLKAGRKIISEKGEALKDQLDPMITQLDLNKTSLYLLLTNSIQ